MNFFRTKIPDVVICEPQVYNDERGYFFESFKKNDLENFLGYKVNFCQDNESKSDKGTLRGLHFQIEPFSQAKLIRVVSGSVIDVAVDLRKNSDTFGQHVKVEISSSNKKQLFIPKGFAHGFLSLENHTIFSYKVDNYYSADHDRGIIYNDKYLDINWSLSKTSLNLSSKDLDFPEFDFNKEYF
tara:strand:- start:1386 stop:1937 length:552 start_codon:yes stop_codon:yes gene_type:complete